MATLHKSPPARKCFGEGYARSDPVHCDRQQTSDGTPRRSIVTTSWRLRTSLPLRVSVLPWRAGKSAVQKASVPGPTATLVLIGLIGLLTHPARRLLK
jgi:hypothetical protein